MTKTWVKETYTAEQLEIIKDSVFKIADAEMALRDLNFKMKRDRKRKGQPQIASIVNSLYELTKDGMLKDFLKELWRQKSLC